MGSARRARGRRAGAHYPGRVPARPETRPEVSVTPTRAKIEHASHDVLQRVMRVPLAAVVGGFVLLVVLGAVLGGVLGALLVLIAAAAVGWLAYLGWPVLTPVERLMRAAVILLLVAVALVAGVSHRLLF